MKKNLNLKKSIIMLIGTLLLLTGLVGCDTTTPSTSTNDSGQVVENNESSSSEQVVENNESSSSDSNSYLASKDNVSNATLSNIPEYSGTPYVAINNNVPDFSESDYTTTSFEEYAPLDNLGRCGVAFANVGTDIMPTEERGSISSVKPSGWHSVKYDIVDGKYLYNRAHLIGYQLTAENANKNNLITGTRYFNVTGMLPFENMVADYVKETNNHVLYRVTPIFEGNDLVAKGVQMEARSVEDNGEGVEFNVFVYNVQPGITIDYSTGGSALDGEAISNEGASSNQTGASAGNSGTSSTSNTNTNSTTNTNNTATTEQTTQAQESSSQSNSTTVIRGNSKSKIYHCPGQRDYENMADSEYLVNFNSEDEAIAAGYRKAKR